MVVNVLTNPAPSTLVARAAGEERNQKSAGGETTRARRRREFTNRVGHVIVRAAESTMDQTMIRKPKLF